MVFFFYGPNSFASRHKLHQMIATYLSKTGSDLGLERIDGVGATAREISNALSAVPFLVSSRLVIIESLGANKEVSAQIENLTRDVPETTVVVFFETEVDKRTNYFKTLVAKAKVAKFEALNLAQLSRWIKNEAAQLNADIEPAAVSLLIDIAGDDQWRLKQEIIKLVNYDSKISTTSVKTMVVATPQQSIFDLVEAMSGGKVKTALVIFRDLIEQRTNEVYILTMIIWQLRNLLLAKTAGNVTTPELSKAAKISPYVAGKALSRTRDFSEDGLKRAFLAAVETDFKLKSGQGDPEQLVERLIYGVATGSA